MATVDVQEITSERADLLHALAAVRADTDREINPQDPSPPVEELAAELAVDSVIMRRRGWVAFVDGVPAGELTVVLESDADNRHITQGEWLAVRPAMRRRGIADALLRAALPPLLADGRTSLILWVPVLEPSSGAGYAARLGLDVRSQERCSRLLVADHDAALVDRWITEGRSRTDGYHIVQYVGPCPDVHLTALAEAHRAMEDMPTDEMEWTIPTMTTDALRSRDRAHARAGRRGVSTLVLDRAGHGAGLSELQINTHRPTLAGQGDTGVRAEHRGHGLGRWLKAENLRLAGQTEPAIAVVETYNAQSNPWMLDINVAMGFRPHLDYQAWQGDLREALAVVS